MYEDFLKYFIILVIPFFIIICLIPFVDYFKLHIHIPRKDPLIFIHEYL